MSLNRTEILLLEAIFFTILWIVDDYVALILTIALTAIIGAVLIISVVSEQIERSKVPKSFFWTLFWAVFPPFIIAIIYYQVIEGHYTWLQEI